MDTILLTSEVEDYLEQDRSSLSVMWWVDNGTIWGKVIELATQLKDKPDKQHETLGWFLVGEGKLEEYIEEFPAKEENVREAKSRLGEPKSCLGRTIQVFKNNFLYLFNYYSWKCLF